MADDNNFVVYHEYLTARCCRDWPHIPYLSIGACALCGRKPEIVQEKYKRPLRPNERSQDSHQ